MSPRIALLAAASSRNEIGGAERFFAGLCNAFNGAGYSAELVPVLNDESGFRNIQETISGTTTWTSPDLTA